MPYQPYTKRLLPANSPVTITAAMRLNNLSLIGRSATVSTILANNAVPGLPAPGAVDLSDGQAVNLIGANGGPIEKIVITIPAGGIVDLIANRI